MPQRVNNTEHDATWPADQWHPAYASIKDWLENEAPISPLVVEHLAKEKNRRMFRVVRRRK
jgi:hypothetical protein